MILLEPEYLLSTPHLHPATLARGVAAINKINLLMTKYQCHLLLICFLWQPCVSLTPGAWLQIQLFISSLILSYTTGSRQQDSGVSEPSGVEDVVWNLHLLNTPATMYLSVMI